jgi:hypothetical protein
MKRKLSKILGIGLTIALLTSLLVTAAPAAALSQPSVTFPTGTDNDISKVNAAYDLTFSVGKQLSGNATAGNATKVQDTITITFPAGYGVANGVGAITGTITIGPGWVDEGIGLGEQWATTPDTLAGTVWTGNAAANTVTLTLPNAGTGGWGEYIGRTAEVLIKINTGITNPATIGNYAITVATSQETTPVAANTVSIEAPYVAPLTGIVSLYNAAGVLMNQWTGGGAIQAAINAAGVGSSIELTNGTYVESPNVLAPNTGGYTIKAVGDAVIVKGTWTLGVGAADIFGNPVDTVLEGMTLMPNAGAAAAVVMNATANNTVIKDCTISKAAVIPGTQVANAGLVRIGAVSGADNRAVVEGCSFDTTDGAVQDTAIQVNNGPVDVTDCTFELDQTVAFADDMAVQMAAAGLAADVVTIDGCTFNGNSGVGYSSNGIVNSAHRAVIKNSTFTGVAKAVYFNSNNGTLSFTSNTVTGGTVNPGSISGAANAVIDLNLMASATIQKNTIEDSNGHSVWIGAAAPAAAVTMNGNYMANNAFGVVNNNRAATLTAELNYWGANTGPTIYTNPGGAGDPVVAVTTTKYGPVDFIPWTNTATTEVGSGNLAVANAVVDTSTTVGVRVSTNTAGVGAVTMMKYDGNPAPIETPEPALGDGYYDVYIPGAGLAGGTQTVMFFNANIDMNTKVYYYSELQKSWVICSSQSVAGNGAYVYVTITNTSSPSNAELNGTIFALVDETTIPAAPSITFADGGGPTVGATDVSVAPTFTWGAVAGAVRYEIALCEDPTFTIIEWAYNVDDPFYKTTEELRYDTTYYWRVRAVLNAAGDTTAWTTGVFTTEAEAEEAAPAVVVEPTKPEVNVEIPATKITVEPSDPVIPTYMLWIIVVVGAVLIIALIVLIVRTRRVA